MLYYDRIHMSEGIGIAESNSSKKCMVCTIVFSIMGSKF